MWAGASSKGEKREKAQKNSGPDVSQAPISGRGAEESQAQEGKSGERGLGEEGPCGQDEGEYQATEV